MRLQIYRFICGTCRKWFDSPQIGEIVYGEFLLRSESGETRFLNAIDDRVFEEVDQILLDDYRVRSLDNFKRSDLLNEVIGIACDPDRTGNVFRIGKPTQCVHCGSGNIIGCESVEPVRCIEMEIPPVTHEKWNHLSNDEKRKQLSSSINAFFR